MGFRNGAPKTQAGIIWSSSLMCSNARMHLFALGGTNTGIYKLLLVLHILSAIVGLGAVMLNGLYAAQAARRPRALGLAVSEANLAVSAIAENVIYAIPVFGSDDLETGGLTDPRASARRARAALDARPDLPRRVASPRHA